MISCEEGLVRRGLVSFPHRILDQSPLVMVAVVAAERNIRVFGFLGVGNTMNVGLHGGKKSMNGGEARGWGYAFLEPMLDSWAGL
ncbi:hypothetical protein SLE2022_333790 [Rubroshorea leprosula]